jgi:membrane protease YdiL (CAAX protease family)
LETSNALEVEAVQVHCQHCNGNILPSDRFCGYCGKEIHIDRSADSQDVFTTLAPTLVYYFVTLVLLAAYKLTDLFPEGFEGMLIISILDIGFVLGFCAYYFKDLKPLFSTYQLNFGIILLTLAGALIGAVVISFVADIINISIQDDVFYSTYLFEDTSNPYFWAILFICVQPAIFEEVTFRGFLYTNLEKVTSVRSVVYITGFIFGVIHLSFISMLWLVPIGLIFAFMRMKYNTLWYGIIGHFTYNLGIVLIDFWGGI